MTSVTEEPEVEPREDDAAVPATAADRPRSSAWFAWTVAAALAVVAVVAVLQWRGLAQPAATADAARDAAVDYVLTLSTWDAEEGLDATYQALVAGAADEFVAEVDEVFGAEQRAGLVAADAVSTGTIEDVLTGQPESGVVPVVVVVDQFVVTGPAADPLARTERVALLRMVEQDGRWLVADLEMLSEVQAVDEGEQ